jgi:hypothetical protein
MAISKKIVAITASDTNVMIFLFIFLCMLFGLWRALSPNGELSRSRRSQPSDQART